MSPTEPIPDSDVPGVVKALFSAVLGSEYTGKFYATESASFPQSSRSGTSEPSSPEPSKSDWAAYWRVRLFLEAAETQRLQGQDIASGDKDGTSTT